MSRRTDADLHGICVVDKPEGWTSHDVVARTRGVLGTRRVGHSGTLDPPATGVLVLGVGRATRVLRYVTELPKSYRGEIVLGSETDTLDDSGEVTATHDMSRVTAGEVARAAADLTGAIEQVPPMVSAVKVEGTRLHELARRGEEVQRPARPVVVHAFETEPRAPGVYACRVECSSGTYVRVLAADLGRALGGGAHLRGLRRAAVGPFTLEQAHDVEAPVLLPTARALEHRPAVTVTGDVAVAVGHGAVLEREELGVTGEGPWAVIDEQGELLAVYRAHRGSTAKPDVVLAR